MGEETFITELTKLNSKTRAKYPSNFNSHHEAYGVLAEEVDEFWEIVRKKREDRSKDDVRAEALDIANVAWRIYVELGEGRHS